ncbi:MAG: O-antigen ligase family protein [Bacteroidales bacterium]|nr:O-antigen ligase family protein [Bacteroidales bacterium]
MKMLSIRRLNYSLVEPAAWFLVWFSLPFSLKLNSVSVILLLVTILVSFIRNPFIPDRRKVWYLCFPVILFLWHAKELLFAHPFMQVWKETEKMLPFLVIPALFVLSRTSKESFTKSAMNGLVSALVISGIIMLTAAAVRFGYSGNYNEFIYHDLAKPFTTGAIYFSLFLLFVLFKLDDPDWMENKPGLKVALAAYFLILLLLFASKLMIGLGLPLLVWHYRRLIPVVWKNNKIWLVLLTVLTVIGSVPFVKRVQILSHPNLELVRSNSFKNDPELNGLNLRLIFWRFGKEILEENHSWMSGVGMKQSQGLLNQKFVQYDMYTGTRKGTDTGFLNYNFHNQFVETLVSVGLSGLLILILILCTFADHAGQGIFAPKVFTLVIVGFFFTESVLERQAGIVFFCLVYAACFIRNNSTSNANGRN